MSHTFQTIEVDVQLTYGKNEAVLAGASAKCIIVLELYYQFLQRERFNKPTM